MHISFLLIILFITLITIPQAATIPQVTAPISSASWQKTLLLSPTPLEQAVSEPSVIYEQGTWKMWYRAGWSNLQGIYYATSLDLVQWNKHGRVSGDYNAHVIRYNSTLLLMYAHGEVGEYSSDGINWHNYTRRNTLHEFGVIANSEPLKLPDGSFIMYYETWNCNSQGLDSSGQLCTPSDLIWHIHAATSPDGIHKWTEYSGNPILSSANSTANPNVSYQNGLYYAFIDYYQWPTISETLAISQDGFHFTYVYGPNNPILKPDVELATNSHIDQVGDAWTIMRPNGIYVFYDADANVAGHGYASIWMAFLPLTLQNSKPRTLTMMAAWLQGLDVWNTCGGSQLTDRAHIIEGLKRGHEVNLITCDRIGGSGAHPLQETYDHTNP